MPRRHSARTDQSYVNYVNRLPLIVREIREQTKLANKDIADEIAREAKERVPVRTGELRDAIHVEFEGDDDWRVVAGDRDRYYGHMVEFGTARAPAHPFLVPAAEAMVPNISRRYKRRYQSLSTRSAIR